MKLLLFTVFIIVVFTDEAYPFPDGEAPEEQDQQMEERNILVADVTQYPEYTDEDYHNIPDGREIQESAEEDRKLKDQLDDMEMLLGRSRWCRKRDGRCSRRKFSCAGGYIESPLGRPYCTSKNRRCCYPGTTSVIPTTTVGTTTKSPKWCSSPWVVVGNQCFLVVTEWRTWESAKHYCNELTKGLTQDVRSHLAIPNDKQALVDYINNTFGARYWYYLGGSDLATEGDWRWVNGTTINYNQGWEPGEPNNCCGGENCLAILPHRGGNTLHDVDCDLTRRFVCERY